MKYQYEIKTSVCHGNRHIAYANSLTYAYRVGFKGGCQNPRCRCGRFQMLDAKTGADRCKDLIKALSA